MLLSPRLPGTSTLVVLRVAGQKLTVETSPLQPLGRSPFPYYTNTGARALLGQARSPQFPRVLPSGRGLLTIVLPLEAKRTTAPLHRLPPPSRLRTCPIFRLIEQMEVQQPLVARSLAPNRPRHRLGVGPLPGRRGVPQVRQSTKGRLSAPV